MGVYLEKRSGKWIARTTTLNGKREHIGTYVTKLEATNAVKLQDMVREMTRLKENEREVRMKHKLEVVGPSIVARERPDMTLLGRVRRYFRERRLMRAEEKEFWERLERP